MGQKSSLSFAALAMIADTCRVVSCSGDPMTAKLAGPSLLSQPNEINLGFEVWVSALGCPS